MRILFTFLLLVALSPDRAQTPAQLSLPDLQTAGSLGADLFARSGSTGMVLIVVRNNQVFIRGYGETGPNSHQTPANDSLLRICSLTKIFTTDLLVKLVNDKTLRLDDTLQTYAPAHTVVPVHSGSRGFRPITLEDLATHTSGLPRELGNGPRGTPHFTFPDYRTRWRWLPNQRLLSTPGTAALYSNIGYDLLSDAMQSAARKPYATLLFERTLSPLKMYETTLYPSAAQCARLMAGANDERQCAPTEASEGSAGLYSTPADMAIWLQYLLGTGGPAIPAQDPGALADYVNISDLARNTGLDHAGNPTRIGLGWLRLLPPDNPSTIMEKTGGGAGFETYIAISQARHTAIFFAATDGQGNAHFNLFQGANDVLLTLAGLPPMPPDPPRPHAKSPRKRRRATRPNQ